MLDINSIKDKLREIILEYENGPSLGSEEKRLYAKSLDHDRLKKYLDSNTPVLEQESEEEPQPFTEEVLLKT